MPSYPKKTAPRKLADGGRVSDKPHKAWPDLSDDGTVPAKKGPTNTRSMVGEALAQTHFARTGGTYSTPEGPYQDALGRNVRETKKK